jgi:hypothetical protein
MALVDDYNASIFFAILVLLILLAGPTLSKEYFPDYLNVFSNEGFKALIILLVLFVSNGDAILSLMITGIFVIIMMLIRENNKRRLKDLKPNKEHFQAGLPVSQCSTYDMKQADFVGMPFYPLNDRNNLVREEPHYRPYLDYTINTVNVPNLTKKVLPSNLNNLEEDNYKVNY